VTRLPKHKDIVLTTHRFPNDELAVVRAIVWKEDLLVEFPYDDIVYGLRGHHLKHRDYGISWVFEDDVEGAAAFRVAVALT
jgi:hypothetical protein